MGDKTLGFAEQQKLLAQLPDGRRVVVPHASVPKLPHGTTLHGPAPELDPVAMADQADLDLNTQMQADPEAYGATNALLATQRQEVQRHAQEPTPMELADQADIDLSRQMAANPERYDTNRRAAQADVRQFAAHLRRLRGGR